MGAHANALLGNWEYWEYWEYWELWVFFAPGCPGKTYRTYKTYKTYKTYPAEPKGWAHTQRICWGERTKTDRNGNSAGVRGEWLSVAFRFPPFLSVPFRFSRQSREDGHTRKGSAAKLEICAGEPGEIAFVHSFFCLIFPEFVRFYSLYSLTYQNYLEILTGRRYITQKYQLYLTCGEKGK